MRQALWEQLAESLGRPLPSFTTATRELRALASAGRQFPRAGKRLITLTGNAAAVPPPPGTAVTAAAEWFLAPYADGRRGMRAVR